jgi:hypothetical protein
MRCTLLIILTLWSLNLFAQRDSSAYEFHVVEKDFSLLLGYNLGSYHFPEIGFALNERTIAGHHPFAKAVYASCEIRAGAGKPVIGPKIGAWVGGGAAGMALGLAAVGYTDLSEFALRLRPEIGIGFDLFKVTYGYNIPLGNADFVRVNRHQLSVALLIPFDRERNAAREIRNHWNLIN